MNVVGNVSNVLHAQTKMRVEVKHTYTTSMSDVLCPSKTPNENVNTHNEYVVRVLLTDFIYLLPTDSGSPTIAANVFF